MQYYSKQHNYYCGIDLHARTMYLCILDSKGDVKLHKNIKTSPDALKKAIKPYLDDLVIGVECMFSLYWVADFCKDSNIKFILGRHIPPGFCLSKRYVSYTGSFKKKNAFNEKTS